jgi:hypothetical protein
LHIPSVFLEIIRKCNVGPSLAIFTLFITLTNLR